MRNVLGVAGLVLVLLIIMGLLSEFNQYYNEVLKEQKQAVIANAFSLNQMDANSFSNGTVAFFTYYGKCPIDIKAVVYVPFVSSNGEVVCTVIFNNPGPLPWYIQQAEASMGETTIPPNYEKVCYGGYILYTDGQKAGSVIVLNTGQSIAVPYPGGFVGIVSCQGNSYWFPNYPEPLAVNFTSSAMKHCACLEKNTTELLEEAKKCLSSITIPSFKLTVCIQGKGLVYIVTSYGYQKYAKNGCVINIYNVSKVWVAEIACQGATLDGLYVNGTLEGFSTCFTIEGNTNIKAVFGTTCYHQFCKIGEQKCLPYNGYINVSVYFCWPNNFPIGGEGTITYGGNSAAIDRQMTYVFSNMSTPQITTNYFTFPQEGTCSSEYTSCEYAGKKLVETTCKCCFKGSYQYGNNVYCFYNKYTCYTCFEYYYETLCIKGSVTANIGLVNEHQCPTLSYYCGRCCYTCTRGNTTYHIIHNLYKNYIYYKFYYVNKVIVKFPYTVYSLNFRNIADRYQLVDVIGFVNATYSNNYNYSFPIICESSVVWYNGSKPCEVCVLVDAVGFYPNFTTIKTSNFETTYCPGCVTDYCKEILMRPILFVKVNALDGAFTMVSYFSALTSSIVTQCINPGETYSAAIPWGYCFNVSAMSFTPKIKICNIQVHNDCDPNSVLGSQCFSGTYTCFIKKCIGNTEKSLPDPFSNTGYSNLYDGLVISIPIVNNATICTKGSGTVYYNVTFAVAWPCLGSILVNDGDQVYEVVTGYTYELQANSILKVENNPTPTLGVWGNYSGLIDAEDNNYYILYPNDSVQLSNEIGMGAFYTPDYEIIVNRDSFTTANYFTLYCIEARIAEGDPPVVHIKISETSLEANGGSACFKGYVSYTNFSEGGFVEWNTLYFDSDGIGFLIDIPINLNTSTQYFAVILSGNLTPASKSCTCACIKVSVSSTNHPPYCIIHFLHSDKYTAHVKSIRINQVIIGYVSWESKGCTHITYTTWTRESYNVTVTYSLGYKLAFIAGLALGVFLTFFGFDADALAAKAAIDAQSEAIGEAIENLMVHRGQVQWLTDMLFDLASRIGEERVADKFMIDIALNIIGIILNNLAAATHSPVLCAIATIFDLVTIGYDMYLNRQLDDLANLIGYGDFDRLVDNLLGDNLIIKFYTWLDIPHWILKKAGLGISDILDIVGEGYDIVRNIFLNHPLNGSTCPVVNYGYFIGRYGYVPAFGPPTLHYVHLLPPSSYNFNETRLEILSTIITLDSGCICNAVNSHDLSKLPNAMNVVENYVKLAHANIIKHCLPGNTPWAFVTAFLCGLGLCVYNLYKAFTCKKIVTLSEGIATVSTTTAQCLSISICNILS